MKRNFSGLTILTLSLILTHAALADSLVNAAVNRGDIGALKRLLAQGDDFNLENTSGLLTPRVAVFCRPKDCSFFADGCF